MVIKKYFGKLPVTQSERQHIGARAGLLAFAQIGVGVTEGARLGIMGEKDKYAGLTPAASRDVMALDDGMLTVVGHGVEIQAIAPGEAWQGGTLT
jgi:hypothetical protein